MKSKVIFHLPLWALIVLLFPIVSCNSNTQKDNREESGDYGVEETNDMYSDDISRQQHGDVISGDEGFIYSYADDNYSEHDNPVAAKQQTASAEKVSTNNTRVNNEKRIPRVKAEPVVYSVSETDRPPLFSHNCLNDEDPAECSRDALKKWVREYLEYPENALAKNQEGVQFVTFVINQKGVISTITHVDSKGQPCDGCSSAAVDAVAQMPDWQPAMKNGKPVSVVVTLPIRFKVI